MKNLIFINMILIIPLLSFAETKKEQRLDAYSRALKSDIRFSNIHSMNIITANKAEGFVNIVNYFSDIIYTSSGGESCVRHHLEGVQFLDDNFSYVCIASYCKKNNSELVQLNECNIRNTNNGMVMSKILDRKVDSVQ